MISRLMVLLVALGLVACTAPAGEITPASATVGSVRAHVYLDQQCNFVFDQPDRNMAGIQVTVDLGGNNVVTGLTNSQGRINVSNVLTTVPAQVSVQFPPQFRNAFIVPCENSPTVIVIQPDDYKGSAVKFINLQFRAKQTDIVPTPSPTATGTARIILRWIGL